MKSLKSLLIAGTVTAVLVFGASDLLAQRGGGRGGGMGGGMGGGGMGGGMGGGGMGGGMGGAMGGGMAGGMGGGMAGGMGGGYDRQQAQMENFKQELGFTDEAEWKAVQPLVQKVLDARTATQTRGGMMGMGMGGMGGGRGGRQRGGGAMTTGFGTTLSTNAPTEFELLQKAIQSGAPAGELKAALTKYNEARKAKEVELEKAQAELRKVLTVRQEAIATTLGLL